MEKKPPIFFFLCLVLSLVWCVSLSGDLDQVIRLNQAGFVSSSTKYGYLQTNSQINGGYFHLLDESTNEEVFKTQIGSSNGNWNQEFAFVYIFNFSEFDQSNSFFRVVAKDDQGVEFAKSASFPIGQEEDFIYSRLLNNSLFFYQTQRDGSDVNSYYLDRKPSHLTDQNATVYESPNYNRNDELEDNLQPVPNAPFLDVSGGWFDAGDFLKFVETASYTVYLMLSSLSDYGGGGDSDISSSLSDEALFGINWLLKMWDGNSSTLYYQVGIGNGNKHITGDHDLWRLPEADDELKIKPGDTTNSDYYIKYRPVFYQSANSSGQLSPNLVGRVAASFALCYRVFVVTDKDIAERCLTAAEQIYKLAKIPSRCESRTLLSVSPHDYYPETEWCSDMELAATELYRATGQSQFLGDGINYATKYTNYYDSVGYFNLYDVGALAHYHLYPLLDDDKNHQLKDSLLQNMKKTLKSAKKQSANDVYGLGFSYDEDLDATPEFLGMAALAYMYQDLTNDTSYRELARRQVDYAMGANGWASSFIVGANTDLNGVDPHCLQHQVANLVGTLDGTPPKLFGGVIDGPTVTSNDKHLGTLPDGANSCKDEQFSSYDRGSWTYKDDARAWASSEPADDYTAMSVFVYSIILARGV